MSKDKGRTNAEVKAAVAAKLASGQSIADVKASAAGQKLGGAAVREVAQNRGYIAPPPAAAVTPTVAATSKPSASPGRTTAEIKTAVANQIAAGTPLAEVKASFAGQKIGADKVKDIWQRVKSATPVETVTSSVTTEPVKEAEDFYSTSPDAIGITEPEFNAAQTAAELQTRSQISNYGWDAQKAIAALQQAGATERTKYEVDNKIPLVQAEAQGKIDLQKIVNAGYKNIANIERGTEMVRNITSMFNF